MRKKRHSAVQNSDHPAVNEPHGEEALFKYPVDLGVEQSREWDIQPCSEYNRTAQMSNNCPKGLKSRML